MLVRDQINGKTKIAKREIRMSRDEKAILAAEKQDSVFEKRSKAQKARWDKKKAPVEISLGTSANNNFMPLGNVTFKVSNPEGLKFRKVEEESNKVQPGNSAAYSSNQSLFFHDIPPEFFRRVAKRHMVGHRKYNDDPVPITMNLNWRIGLDDPLYVMDRLNHMFEHAVNFLESGNQFDDNLGAIGWCVCFLMEVERMHPDVLQQVIGQCNYSGKIAAKYQQDLQHASLVASTINELNSDSTIPPPSSNLPTVKSQGNARKHQPRRKKTLSQRSREYMRKNNL